MDPVTGATYRASSVLSRNAIPFIIPPTGTMGNNGAYTSGTALATTYATCFLWFAANQIFSGSTAGWYYAVASSTTVFTVYNNTYSSGTPAAPASPTAFVSTGPGSITGVTSQVSGPAIALAAGSMGANGVLRITSLWSVPNNGNSKTTNINFVGASNILNNVLTTVAQASQLTTVWNRGAQNSQVSFPAANQTGIGTASGTMNFQSVDTSQAQTIGFNGTLATATDYIVLEAFLIEVLPG
jgi:hypothetical protein